MDAFETVTLASEFPEPLTWRHEGLCRLDRGDRTWEQNVNAEWTDLGHGDCDDPDRSVWFVPGGRLGQRMPGTSIKAVDESWSTEHAYPRTTDNTTTTLEWWAMWHRASAAPAAATVLLFERPGSIIFPHQLPVVPGVPGRRFRENGLRAKLFGREALLRFTNIGDEELLALAYEGSPFDEPRSMSILTVLSLALGRDLEALAEVVADVQGRMAQRRLWRRYERCSGDWRPALNCIEEATTTALGQRLELMAKNARWLRYDKASPIDVAVKQLLSPNGGRLDFEIRDIALALDSIIESPAFSAKKGRIVTRELFLPLRDRLLRHLERMKKMPEDLRARFEEAIRQANNRSTRQRRAAFWKSLGHDEPPTDAKMLEQRRNTMSHKGFIDIDDPAEELQLLEDVSRARTLVNEVLLSILGYRAQSRTIVRGKVAH
jgi:hypothetical protein